MFHAHFGQAAITDEARRPRIRAAGVGLLVLGLALAACADESPDAETDEETDEPDQYVEIDAEAQNEAAAARLPGTFDFQAHRAGRGEYTEHSREAFETALEDGVTTLELDITLSADGDPMVWHDFQIEEGMCADTDPVDEDDPDFPYVGQDVAALTTAQLETLDCGLQQEDFPDAEVVEGHTLLTLDEVFVIAEEYPEVHFNIETKIDSEDLEASGDPQEMVDTILDTAGEAGVTDRVMMQSFHWETLDMAREREPDLPLALLWDETTWFPESEWTAPVDYGEVGGDIFTAAEQLDVQVLSPGYAQPSGPTAGDDDYNPVATEEFLADAHERGMRVVPWTVNDAATMEEQLDAGVDGLITDYPTELRNILDERGIEY